MITTNVIKLLLKDMDPMLILAEFIAIYLKYVIL